MENTDIEKAIEDLQELYSWDFKDTEEIPNGYDWTKTPKATNDTIAVLLQRINTLSKAVTYLLEENQALKGCNRRKKS